MQKQNSSIQFTNAKVSVTSGKKSLDPRQFASARTESRDESAKETSWLWTLETAITTAWTNSIRNFRRVCSHEFPRRLLSPEGHSNANQKNSAKRRDRWYLDRKRHLRHFAQARSKYRLWALLGIFFENVWWYLLFSFISSEKHARGYRFNSNLFP